MRPARIAALVIGCLAVIPGISLLLGGCALGGAWLVLRDDDGYVDATLDRLQTGTAALTSDELTFGSEPGSPDWLLDRLDVDVRLKVASASRERPVFVGIARSADVDAYLASVSHDEVIDINDDLEPEYRAQPGTRDPAPPRDQDFWVAQASGTGEQELRWEAESGKWAVVVMNADGSRGVSADVNVGAKAGFIMPLAFALAGLGLLMTAAGVVLIVVGASGAGRAHPAPGVPGAAPAAAPVASPGAAAPAGAAYPLRLEARLDEPLSRWLWLVKWFLAIPHAIVLAFLWVGFVVLTVLAWFAILFSGRYPKGFFDFNVGVLRWTWRVGYYATGGGLGTDRYPPFSLDHHPDYPATLEVVYPERLSRGLVLVKSWLLALPHLLIVALLTGGWWGWGDAGPFPLVIGGVGVIGLLVVIAGLALLFTGRYQPALFDLILGLNRWVYRVVAYVALLTDDYPPFRLDQGGPDPGGAPPAPAPPPGPAVTAT